MSMWVCCWSTSAFLGRGFCEWGAWAGEGSWRVSSFRVNPLLEAILSATMLYLLQISCMSKIKDCMNTLLYIKIWEYCLLTRKKDKHERYWKLVWKNCLLQKFIVLYGLILILLKISVYWTNQINSTLCLWNFSDTNAPPLSDLLPCA